MEIASKAKRQLIFALALGTVPNLILAGIIALFFNDTYTPFWEVFLFTLAGIYIISLVFWLRDTTWEWGWYFYKGKKELVSNFVKHLKEHKYPEPDEYIDSGIDWLTHVAENKECDPELRIYAAAESGALNAMRSNALLQRFFRVAIAIDEAILEYKKTFPHKDIED